MKLSKMWVWDPESGKNLYRIPDPQYWTSTTLENSQFIGSGPTEKVSLSAAMRLILRPGCPSCR
jgi:hypothetical protein